MKLSDVFDIIQGHQITDEEIYNPQGDYPIYTGPNTVKGYWDKTIVTKDQLPCITYATKAFDGTVTVQDSLFDANNTGVLTLKEDYIGKVDLDWIKFVLSNKFKEVITSRDGVSYLNKEIVENIDLIIPDEDTQREQKQAYLFLDSIRSRLETIRANTDSILNKTLTHDYDNYIERDVPVDRLFECMSGNSGLTEELIYHNLPDDEGVEVLSAATTHGKHLGFISRNAKINGKNLKISKNKESILVVRKGKAGKIRYLPKNTYTINDDAYLLHIRDEYLDMINLRWLVLQYKDMFLQYSSSSDNGTWNKTGFFEEATVDIPCYKEQLEVVDAYSQMFDLQDDICTIEEYVRLLQERIIA